MTTSQRVYLPFKRLFDIVFSIVALVVLSPLFLVVAVIIKLDSPGPVIFRQKRAGKDGAPFTMYKFRSMCKDAEHDLLAMDAFSGHLSVTDIKLRLENDPRITKFGKFLRRTSIDELPQFANVLIGNMSVVGPRPLSLQEHEALTEQQQTRVSIKQGITCYWQVSGRSTLNEETRSELDQRYLKNFSPITDIVLVIKTIPAVLSGKGAF